MYHKHLRVFLLCTTQTSPPTTISGIRTVGMASETGTPWASFPHVPIAKPISLPTISIDFNISGPLPINVAPLTGSPICPLLIRCPSETSKTNFLGPFSF